MNARTAGGLHAPPKEITAEKTTIVSFLVDVLDLITTVVAAVLTGSVVMLAEALQAGADLISAGFLLIGLKLAKRPAHERHPFGHGREIFIWTLFSSLVMFMVVATLSFYFGWQRFLHPEPIDNIPIALFVLGLGVLTNGYALSLSFRRLFFERNGGLIADFFDSMYVETKATFILDLIGSLASVSGIIALVLYLVTGDGRFDGIGSMVIGSMMGVLALLLLISVKDFLVGRTAPKRVQENISAAAMSINGVLAVLDLHAIVSGPSQLLVNIEIAVKKRLHTDDIEKIIDDVKAKIVADVPTVDHVQVEIETDTRYKKSKAGEGGIHSYHS